MGIRGRARENRASLSGDVRGQPVCRLVRGARKQDGESRCLERECRTQCHGPGREGSTGRFARCSRVVETRTAKPLPRAGGIAVSGRSAAGKPFVQRGKQFVRIAAQVKGLEPRRRAGAQADIGFRHGKPFCEEPRERSVRRALFRHCPHAGGDMRSAAGGLPETDDLIARGARRQADVYKEPVLNGACGKTGVAGRSRQSSAGATVVIMNWRRKKMMSRRIIGEMSIPPRSGRNLRIGRRAGSVAL